MTKKEFLITSASGLNQRLDVFLSQKISILTRSQIQRIIKENKVRVSGIARKSNYRLKNGENVQIYFENAEPKKIFPEKILIDVRYEDDHLMIINKPSGLVVHPGAGIRQGTLVNALLFYFPEIKEVGPEERPGIVHRLDKETSGLMVVAKTLNAFNELQEQFRKREVDKSYLGLVWGKLSKKEGKIVWPLGRHRKYGERISVKTSKPRKAETQYSVLQVFQEFTLLEIKPITGIQSRKSSRDIKIKIPPSSDGICDSIQIAEKL